MALSKDMRNFVKDMADNSLEGLVISDREGLELLGQMINWINSGNEDYTLNGASPAPGILTATATVQIRGFGSRYNQFDQTSEVEAYIVSSTAPDAAIDGGAGPVLLTMVDGMATVEVSASAAGDVTIGLQNPNPASTPFGPFGLPANLTVTFS